MKLNKTWIIRSNPGKRKKQYVVTVRYRDVKGKIGSVELTRDDIAKIVKVAIK